MIILHLLKIYVPKLKLSQTYSNRTLQQLRINSGNDFKEFPTSHSK